MKNRKCKNKDRRFLHLAQTNPREVFKSREPAFFTRWKYIHYWCYGKKCEDYSE